MYAYMKTKTIWAGLLLVAVLPATAFAQKDSTMNRTVVVENQYNPYLMEATKLNLQPAVEETKTAPHAADYARTVRGVADWGQNEMPLLRSPQDEAQHGYVRLGYGLRGRVNAAAGCLWDITSRDRLQADVALDGWNGNRPADWTSHLYRTRAALDYRHRFGAYELTLGGGWRNTVFNYMPTSNQRFTEGEAYAGLRSTDKSLPLQFAVQAGYRSFLVAHDGPSTEKQFHALGDVWAPVSETQRVGVAFTVDNSAIGLNPYFAYETADWRIRLGVHVDPLLSGEDKGVDVAPDIRLERVFNRNSVLYVHALGGREVNDYRRQTSLSPYVGVMADVIPTYVPLNATLGYRLSPVPGAWIHLFGGYQIRNHELFGTLADNATYTYVALAQEKGKLAFGGAELKYGYKDVWDVTAKATLYDWKVDDEALLAFKPRYEWNVQAQGRLMDGLKIQAGFDYVDRREPGTSSIQNLYTGASYDLVHRITVFARVNNILNKRYAGLDLYPAEKLGFLAGLQWVF
jgi:hypothetical protein